jgi:hypothetical protein
MTRQQMDDAGGADVEAMGDAEHFQFLGQGCIFTRILPPGWAKIMSHPGWGNQLAEAIWTNTPPTTVTERLQHAYDTVGTLEIKTEDLPAALLFKTARGEAGILELLELVDLASSSQTNRVKPYGMKLRYKLVQQTANALQPSQSGGSASTEPRRFPGVVLFINNLRYSERNGCTSEVGLSGKSVCGHTGAVSVVEWAWLRTTREGDDYRFTRVFPSDTPTAETSVKDVTYAGGDLVLWEDKAQRIVLRPKESRLPSLLQFRWVAAPADTNAVVDEFARFGDGSGQTKLRVLKGVVLDSAAIASTICHMSTNGIAEISVQLTEAGAREFSRLTAANIGRQLAIIYQGRVLSAPVIQTAIPGPGVNISGNLNDAEMQQLVDVLNNTKNETRHQQQN